MASFWEAISLDQNTFVILNEWANFHAYLHEGYTTYIFLEI